MIERIKEAWRNDVAVALVAAFVGGFGLSIAVVFVGAGIFLLEGIKGVVMTFLGVGVSCVTYFVGLAIFNRAERLRSLRWEKGDWR